MTKTLTIAGKSLPITYTYGERAADEAEGVEAARWINGQVTYADHTYDVGGGHIEDDDSLTPYGYGEGENSELMTALGMDTDAALAREDFMLALHATLPANWRHLAKAA